LFVLLWFFLCILLLTFTYFLLRYIAIVRAQRLHRQVTMVHTALRKFIFRFRSRRRHHAADTIRKFVDGTKKGREEARKEREEEEEVVCLYTMRVAKYLTKSDSS
jgi:hypothetical protein